jgi:hypothetical protein
MYTISIDLERTSTLDGEYEKDHHATSLKKAYQLAMALRSDFWDEPDESFDGMDPYVHSFEEMIQTGTVWRTPDVGLYYVCRISVTDPEQEEDEISSGDEEERLPKCSGCHKRLHRFRSQCSDCRIKEQKKEEDDKLRCIFCGNKTDNCRIHKIKDIKLMRCFECYDSQRIHPLSHLRGTPCPFIYDLEESKCNFLSQTIIHQVDHKFQSLLMKTDSLHRSMYLHLENNYEFVKNCRESFLDCVINTPMNLSVSPKNMWDNIRNLCMEFKSHFGKRFEQAALFRKCMKVWLQYQLDTRDLMNEPGAIGQEVPYWKHRIEWEAKPPMTPQ